MKASVSNAGNVEYLTNGPTIIKASARVMNQSLLNARFEIPNKKFNHGYRVRGSLQPTALLHFNPVIIPNATARIETGRLKTFVFNFSYNETRSTGNLTFEYDNLSLAFLNTEDGSKRKIKSLLANSFVVKKENLNGTKSYKNGSISFERDKKKSVFNYWWKSVLSGIESISIV